MGILKPKEAEGEKPVERKKFKTFAGVFTPTLLTVLGVIMYLREGWVVGNAGLFGAWAIILLACVITIFTALSLSSITTNIRIGSGGAFSVISQSLGLEAGGAIGLPLYLSQALAITMYIFGFREGWTWIFPDHNALLVDFLVFALIFGIAYVSTSLAFRIQYVVMAIILGSLVVIVIPLFQGKGHLDFEWFGSYPGSPENSFSGANFWIVFAVFFPAVTGVMAGANMSGDLKDPRVSIPKGTLGAMVLATVVYLGVALVLAMLATPDELISNYTVLIDKAAWGPIVLAGLLGATFSSALSSLVGAPRILQALSEKKLLPGAKQFGKLSPRGEPRNAMWLTGGIVLLALLLRNLNAVAPLITMFFLITYAMINMVVLIEKSLGQLSFRPTFKIHIAIPLIGAGGCLFVMFIINSTVSLIAVAVVLGMYIFLARRQFAATSGDSRSGIFTAVAEWASKMVGRLPEATERSWQPNFLVPAETTNDVVRAYRLIYTILYPKGSIKILGLVGKQNSEEENLDSARLDQIVKEFEDVRISAIAGMIEVPSFGQGTITSMQALQASFFKPNLLFLSLLDESDRDPALQQLVSQAHRFHMGASVYVPYRKVGLGLEKVVNLWLWGSLSNLQSGDRLKFNNLGILISYILQRNWTGQLRVIVRIDSADEKQAALDALEHLAVLARLPKNTEFIALVTEGQSEAYATGFEKGPPETST